MSFVLYLHNWLARCDLQQAVVIEVVVIVNIVTNGRRSGHDGTFVAITTAVAISMLGKRAGCAQQRSRGCSGNKQSNRTESGYLNSSVDQASTKDNESEAWRERGPSSFLDWTLV